MTRTAPLLTLLAVGVLGGALFMASAMGDEQSATIASAGAAGTAPAPAPAPAGVEVPVADLPVAGPAGGVEAGRIEIDLGEIPLGVAPAQPPVVEAAPEAAPPAPEAAPEAAPPAPEAAPPAAESPEAAPPDEATYAGATADDRMTVAIAVKDGRAVAYVCDGGALEVWLSGSAAGGRVALESKTGLSTMTGTLADGELAGTVTIDGDASEYSTDSTSVAAARENGRPDVADVAERAGLVSE